MEFALWTAVLYLVIGTITMLMEAMGHKSWSGWLVVVLLWPIFLFLAN